MLSPIAQLIPKSNRSYFLVFLLALAFICGCDVLYVASVRWSGLTTDGSVAAFDLDGEGSLSSWFSIVLLMCCGLAALAVRSIRVSTASPDRARFESRFWAMITVVWIGMSMDEGSSLHEGFKEMMSRWMGTRISGDGSLYWAIPYFLVLSVTGTALLWQYRRCFSAAALLLAAGAAHVVAVLAQLEWILPGIWPAQIVVEETGEMVGYLCILTSLGLFARSAVPVCTAPAAPDTIPRPHLLDRAASCSSQASEL